MSKQHHAYVLLALLLASTAAVWSAEPGELVFQDEFNGKLAEGWSWEREDRTAWRVGPPGLEVRVQPGNMWGSANNAKNVLVRPIPAPADTPVEISVTFSNAPTAQWEQADLAWFYDDSNMVKLGKELVSGRLSIVMGREENDRARTVAIVPLDDHTVELRLQAVNNQIRGQFRTRPWSEWRDVGECDLPVKGEPKASLQFYNGPPDKEHWIHVNRFAVRRLKSKATNWPRVRVSENTYRITGGGLGEGDRAVLSLDDGKLFTLVSDPEGLVGDAQVNCEQRIFRHEDGSCGWTWDRRASASKEPILLGIGAGNFNPHNRTDSWFPMIRLDKESKEKSFAMELDAVTRLDNDAGNHDLSIHVWLTAAETGWPLTHRISILFDWYGKQATGQSVNDGYRDYEYVETRPDRQQRVAQFQYRIRGFRGAPPKVSLQAFVADAARRGLPADARIVGVWFGNEVWDGSHGGTLVTRLDLVVDGKRYSSLH